MPDAKPPISSYVAHARWDMDLGAVVVRPVTAGVLHIDARRVPAEPREVARGPIDTREDVTDGIAEVAVRGERPEVGGRTGELIFHVGAEKIVELEVVVLDHHATVRHLDLDIDIGTGLVFGTAHIEAAVIVREDRGHVLVPVPILIHWQWQWQRQLQFPSHSFRLRECGK